MGVRVWQVYTGERIIRSSLSRIVARGPIGLIATLVRPRSEDLFAKRSSILGKSPDSAALVGLEGRWAVGHFSRFGAHLLPEHVSQFDPKVPHFSVYYPRVFITHRGRRPSRKRKKIVLRGSVAVAVADADGVLSDYVFCHCRTNCRCRQGVTPDAVVCGAPLAR